MTIIMTSNLIRERKKLWKSLESPTEDLSEIKKQHVWMKKNEDSSVHSPELFYPGSSTNVLNSQ